MEPVNEGHFSSPVLKKAFILLRERWEAGKSVSLSALDGQFAPEEIDRKSVV